MKSKHLILIVALLALCGCAAKKRVVAPPEDFALTWQTVHMSNTLLELDVDGQNYSVSCQIQGVRDSMLVVSLMPMMNMEMMRLEITPDEALAIDKVNHRYTRLELSKAAQHVVPGIQWTDLQKFLTGTGGLKQGETMSLGYNFQGHKVQLKLTYGTIAYDAPVNVRHLKLDRFDYVDLLALLQ